MGGNGLTDVTPDRRIIDGVFGPYDRVNKHVETADSGPEHVQAGARVLRLPVPRKANNGEKQTKEGKCGKNVGGCHVGRGKSYEGGKELEKVSR